jgi:hypothetical protein
MPRKPSGTGKAGTSNHGNSPKARRKYVGEKGVEDAAQQVADYIYDHLMEAVGNREVLEQAIIAIFGSLEQFQQDFYAQLNPEQRSQFGTMIDALIHEKQQKKKRLFEILQSESMKQVIENLRLSGIRALEKADHAAKSPGSGVGSGKGKDESRNR